MFFEQTLDTSHVVGTAIEWSKNIIDQINAYHSKEDHFQCDSLTKTVSGIHFYDSIIVIDKQVRNNPYQVNCYRFAMDHRLDA